MARVIQNRQLELGEVDVSQITFNPKSRDDIPRILQGLQYLYVNEELRAKLFSILPKLIHDELSWTEGRPGMSLWSIFVLGTLRVNLNWDYDRLEEMVNHHSAIREMLGHPDIFDKRKYHRQTLKDNLCLFTPELLDKINQLVIEAGHGLVKKKETEPTLSGRCDSFVVETNVHYPTDATLLFDAMRKVIQLASRASASNGDTQWRQSRKHIKDLKKLMREVQNAKHKRGNLLAKESRQQKAYRSYVCAASKLLDRGKKTLHDLEQENGLGLAEKQQWGNYILHANRQIDQIDRRVFQGKVIPHADKVFSVFEEHTEWVSKGKAGVPVELGLRVSVMEDQYGFILHHQVMEKKTDDKVALSMVEATKRRHGNFVACSFDKGYYSPKNKHQLEEIVELTMPKKGRLNKQEYEAEHAETFIRRRRQHSAVESAINALGCHGLDRCRDKGLDGFKRYVSFAVVGRNIQQIGMLLRDRRKRRRLMQKAA